MLKGVPLGAPLFSERLIVWKKNYGAAVSVPKPIKRWILSVLLFIMPQEGTIRVERRGRMNVA